MKYRKRPVVIEAIQWTGENVNEISEFMGFKNLTFECLLPDSPVPQLQIDTLEGRMTASVGDYIIKGIDGEFYPCKPAIFEKTYIRDE